MGRIETGGAAALVAIGAWGVRAERAAETINVAAKESQFIYRGVPAGTERFTQALRGIVQPRGAALDALSLENHVLNNPVSAGVTSWTTDKAVAASFAGSEGKILQVPLNKVADRIVPRPYVGGKYGHESEILLQGVINLNQ